MIVFIFVWWVTISYKTWIFNIVHMKREQIKYIRITEPLSDHLIIFLHKLTPHRAQLGFQSQYSLKQSFCILWAVSYCPWMNFGSALPLSSLLLPAWIVYLTRWPPPHYLSLHICELCNTDIFQVWSFLKIHHKISYCETNKQKN